MARHGVVQRASFRSMERGVSGFPRGCAARRDARRAALVSADGEAPAGVRPRSLSWLALNPTNHVYARLLIMTKAKENR